MIYHKYASNINEWLQCGIRPNQLVLNHYEKQKAKSRQMSVVNRSERIIRWANRQLGILFRNILEINKGDKAVRRLLAFETAQIKARKANIAGEAPALIRKLPTLLPYKLDPMSKPFWYKMTPVDGNMNELERLNRTLYVGPEHPALETFVISIAKMIAAKKVLEIGYQCGALMFALVEYLAGNNEDWNYSGIDIEEAYKNEICYASSLVPKMLDRMGISHAERLHIYKADAAEIIIKLAEIQETAFDLIVIDHDKPLYPTCYKSLRNSGLLGPNTPVVFHDIYTHAKTEWKKLRHEYSNHIIFESIVGRSGDIGVIWGQ